MIRLKGLGNNKGFTMVEVIIAGSIAMMTALAMGVMMTANSRSSASGAAIADFNTLVAILQNTLTDPTNCKSVLGIFKMNPPTTPGDISPPQTISPLATHGVSGATGLIIAQKGPLGTTLDITNLEFNYATPTSAPNEYMTKIHLAAKKYVSGGAVGSSTLIHDFQAVLTIDPAQGNLIVSCRGQTTSWQSSGSGNGISTTGDVTIGTTGPSGVKADLHVTGNMYSDTMWDTFTVGGASSQFCPVIFKPSDLPLEPDLGSNSPYPNGVSRRLEFEIYRDNVHEYYSGNRYDYNASAGDFRLIVSANGGGVGGPHSAARIQYYYYQPECWNGGAPCDGVADIKASASTDSIIVYLQGGAVYHLKNLQPNTGTVLVDPNSACASKTLGTDPAYTVLSASSPSLVRGQYTYPQGIALGPNALPNSNATVLYAKRAGSGAVAYFSDTTTGRSVQINTEQGGGGASVGIQNSGQYWDFGVDTSGRVFISPAGSTGLILYTNGNGYLRGSLSQNSDKRLKTDILEIPNALAKVDAIPGVSFNWKDEEQRKEQGPQIGVIAQAVQEQVPELVKEIDNPDTKSSLKKILTVEYGHLSALVLQAVRELHNLVKQFQASDGEEIKEIKARLDKANSIAERNRQRVEKAERNTAELKTRLDRIEGQVNPSSH